jgi:dolichyl-phosphate beta-glucosyltransferase
MKKAPFLTVLIPTYNEEKLIDDTLEMVSNFLKSKEYSWEIVVSDDGSRDKTTEIINRIKKNNIKLVSNPKNQGKGAALRQGIKAAAGKYVIFMDADLSVPLKYVDQFVAKFRDGSEVVIASRRVTGAKIEVHQPWHRETLGKGYTKLTQIITGVKIADFTCGFKGFSKTAAKKIFGNSIIDRWAYDSEIMFLAKKYGYEVVQVPIIWKNRGDTRVKLRSVILESFLDLLKVRWNNLTGIYDK